MRKQRIVGEIDVTSCSFQTSQRFYSARFGETKPKWQYGRLTSSSKKRLTITNQHIYNSLKCMVLLTQPLKCLENILLLDSVRYAVYFKMILHCTWTRFVHEDVLFAATIRLGDFMFASGEANLL